MYLTVGVVFVVLITLLSPVIWVAWWLIADLGSHANGSYRDSRREHGEGSYRQAA